MIRGKTTDRKTQGRRLIAAAQAALLIGAVSAGTAGAGADQNTVRWSPDGTLRAVVHFKPARGGGDPESVVEIQTARGWTVASRDYSSQDGSHGHAVKQGRWTPDSRFFVFSLVNSGGHSPWHTPTHFFSRKRHRFYGLDDFLPGRAVASPSFRVSRPAIVRVIGRDGRPIRVDLRRLQARLAPDAARSEYDNY